MEDSLSQDIQYAELELALDYRFKNRELLKEAVTHRSYCNESAAKAAKDNERLEFFGDAALDFFVSAILMQLYPDSREGELSRIRASLVEEAALARLAQRLDLGRYLRLGRGEEKSGGREKRSLLANTYEAVVAALYLDGGADPAGKLVARDISWLLEQRKIDAGERDYKTEFQEKAQAGYGTLPRYELKEVTGPSHQQHFVVTALIGSALFGEGSGSSKKAAEQAAAKIGLAKIASLTTAGQS